MARAFVRDDSQYLTVAAAPVTVTPFSVSLWFYKTDTHDDTPAISINDGEPDGQYFGIAFNYGAGAQFVYAWAEDSGGSSKASSTAEYSLSTWHHGAGVFTNSTLRAAFLDGANKGTNTTSRTPAALDNTDISRVGYGVWAYYSGYLAEIAVWGVALTDDEVAILGKGYSPLSVRRQNLVAYWPLIRNDRDWVGGYHLTPYNSPTIVAHTRVLYPAPILMIPTPAAAGAVYELSATALAQSTTPDDAALPIARELAATALSQSATPDDAILGLSLPMTAILASASVTPDDVVLVALRELAAIALSQSTTPDDVALAVARELVAILLAQSVTPDDADLSVSGIIEFVATLLAQSATPDTSSLAVTRELLAVSLAQSVTPDDAVLGLIYQMAATALSQSTTPDDAALAIMRQLAATLAASSVTPDDAALVIARVMAAIALAQSATPDDATLSILGAVETPTSRIFRVPLESRTDSVVGEIRALIVPLEDRTLKMN